MPCRSPGSRAGSPGCPARPNCPHRTSTRRRSTFFRASRRKKTRRTNDPAPPELPTSWLSTSSNGNRYTASISRHGKGRCRNSRKAARNIRRCLRKTSSRPSPWRKRRKRYCRQVRQGNNPRIFPPREAGRSSSPRPFRPIRNRLLPTTANLRQASYHRRRNIQSGHARQRQPHGLSCPYYRPRPRPHGGHSLPSRRRDPPCSPLARKVSSPSGRRPNKSGSRR